jgi:hypothetical protein
MSIKAFMMYGIGMTMALDAEYKQRRDDLRRDWRKTYDMPRKMKKNQRKVLAQKWSINEFLKPLQF